MFCALIKQRCARGPIYIIKADEPQQGGLEALPMMQRVKARASFTDVNKNLC